MTVDTAHAALSVAKVLQETSDLAAPLPSETQPPAEQAILPHSLFSGTRGYIECVVYQINASYSATCYDACAVMIRRLVEMLIIEVYEHHHRGTEIKDSDGNYVMLDALIKRVLDGSWSIGRATKSGLRKLKSFGDLSAHSRRYNARREYVDGVVVELRVICEELLYLAKLRK